LLLVVLVELRGHERARLGLRQPDAGFAILRLQLERLLERLLGLLEAFLLQRVLALRHQTIELLLLLRLLELFLLGAEGFLFLAVLFFESLRRLQSLRGFVGLLVVLRLLLDDDRLRRRPVTKNEIRDAEKCSADKHSDADADEHHRPTIRSGGGLRRGCGRKYRRGVDQEVRTAVWAAQLLRGGERFGRAEAGATVRAGRHVAGHRVFPDGGRR